MNLYEELEWRGLIKDVTDKDNVKKLLNEDKITFYWGTDPSADSLHIGHLTSLLMAERLRRFGHKPIILIGGSTGLIGDPRPSSERPMIKKETVINNFESLKKQISSLFDFKIVNNYDWSKDINFIDYLRDYGKYFNINTMLSKDIIKRRLETGITYTEFSYMIMQALDFNYLNEQYNCKLQISGSDQWGNVTAGTELIKKKNNITVEGLTMPLLTDQNGNKIGKSEGNAVWIDQNKTSSYELYQYFLNTDDSVVIKYLKFFTFLSKTEIELLEQSLKNEPEKRAAQHALAENVIDFLHGKGSYERSFQLSKHLFDEKYDELTFEEIKGAFKETPTFTIEKTDNLNIIELLVDKKICLSKREARELVNNNAIKVNGIKVADEMHIINNFLFQELLIIKRGKKNYYLGKIKHD